MSRSNLKYAWLSKPDPEFAPFLDSANEFKELLKLPLKEIREAEASDIHVPAVPQEIEHVELDVSFRRVKVRDGVDIEIRVMKSKNVKSRALLFLVMHGGGWTVGNHTAEEAMSRYVAVKINSVIISVDYRLAPEYRFPYAINDCYDVMKWCIKNANDLGIDPQRIVVGGSSAGGNLAATLSLMARDNGLNNIIGQVISIPVTCHPKLFPKDKYEYNSYEQNSDAPLLTSASMDWFWDQYLPDPVPDPYVNPLLAKSHKGLPPALVLVAGQDPLRDEGIAYSLALLYAGIPVTLKLFPGVPHGFMMIPGVKHIQEYVENIVDFINSLPAPCTTTCL